MRTLLAVFLLALAGGFAHAQPVEQVLDNVTPAFSAGANWTVSTSVSGYLGTNYQARAPGLLGPTSIVVDNTDAGFSVTGTWPVSTSVGGYLGANYSLHSANGESPAAVVVDNTAGTVTGTWPNSTSVGGYIGTNYQVHTAGTGTNVFTWPFSLASAGQYQVYARWTQHPNRATNAQYTVNHGSGSSTVAVNQEAGGGAWHLLGTWGFNAGAGSVSLSDAANEYVVADAIKIVPENAQPNTATWTLVVPETKSYRVYARWTAHPNRATDAQYTVNHAGGVSTVAANQEAGSGLWNLLGTWSFNAGNATVTLNDQANGYVIADAIRMDPTDAIPDVATWTPTLTQPTKFEVYARWTANPNRATDAAYTVTHSTGTSTVTANQQANGGAWNLLGTYIFNPGHKVQLAGDGNGYVIADAVRLVPTADQPSTVALYYIHADHLNTPRLVADQTQKAVWKWEQAEPFGNSAPDEDPDQDGAVFTMNLRFPGQYFDRETGLSYNYYRDYDSSVGRYAQSDPIGLFGGLNTYSHVLASPLLFTDKSGLVTTITIWEPVGWGASSGGHVTTEVNGTTYSFTGAGMSILPTAQYNAASSFRNGVSMRLELTPQQEKEFESCLRGNQGNYNLISNNCGAPAQSCLALLGINIGYAVAPASVGNNILNSKAFQGATIIPATNPSISRGSHAPWTR